MKKTSLARNQHRPTAVRHDGKVAVVLGKKILVRGKAKGEGFGKQSQIILDHKAEIFSPMDESQPSQPR